jgi:hypothetical protein
MLIQPNNLQRKVTWSEVENFSPVVDQSLIPFGNYQELKNLNKKISKSIKVYRYEMPAGILEFRKSKFFDSSPFENILYVPSFYSYEKNQLFEEQQNKKILEQVIPTMSMRTVWCKDGENTFFAKFSYDQCISGASRILSKHEACYSLYSSDSLRENWQSEVFHLIWDNMFIDHPNDLKYRCLIRSDDYLYNDFCVVPLANYCKIVNQKYSDKSAIWKFKNIFQDILISLFFEMKKSYENGISFEIHGQNLLLAVNSIADPEWTGHFFYRDFGNIGLCREVRYKRKILSSTEREKLSTWPCINSFFYQWQFGKTLANDLLSSMIFSLIYYGDKNDNSQKKVYDEYRKLVNKNFHSSFHI